MKGQGFIYFKRSEWGPGADTDTTDKMSCYLFYVILLYIVSNSGHRRIQDFRWVEHARGSHLNQRGVSLLDRKSYQVGAKSYHSGSDTRILGKRVGEAIFRGRHQTSREIPGPFQGAPRVERRRGKCLLFAPAAVRDLVNPNDFRKSSLLVCVVTRPPWPRWRN